jgi:chorismate mutase
MGNYKSLIDSLKRDGLTVTAKAIEDLLAEIDALQGSVIELMRERDEAKRELAELKHDR